jgi:hypothetical protein
VDNNTEDGMSMRMGLMSAVVVVSMVGCGEDASEAEGRDGIRSKREEITYTGTTGSGLADVATGGKAVGTWAYARNTSSNRLYTTVKNNPNTWYLDTILTETFQGRIGAAALNGDCDITAARRSNGTIGYVPWQWQGLDFMCVPNSSSFQAIPNSPTVAGSPAVSAWYSGGSQRVDVFARNSNNNIVRVTGTGSSGTTLSWGAWTTDTGITLLSGSDPGAISPTPGMRDRLGAE